MTTGSANKTALARGALRRRYRPAKVRLLFVGESPPASGRFFYQADSGLYRAVRNTFADALPNLKDGDFLESFRDLGCYLVDLCGTPVDRMSKERRKKACADGEIVLARGIRKLQPEIVITVLRSISANVRRSLQKASWKGTLLELPYPGRWKEHREAFKKALVPLLRAEFGEELRRKSLRDRGGK